MNLSRSVESVVKGDHYPEVGGLGARLEQLGLEGDQLRQHVDVAPADREELAARLAPRDALGRRLARRGKLQPQRLRQLGLRRRDRKIGKKSLLLLLGPRQALANGLVERALVGIVGNVVEVVVRVVVG